MGGDDRQILLSYNIVKSKNIWVLYQGTAHPLAGDLQSFTSGTGTNNAYIIPKLVIEPISIDISDMTIK